MSTFDIVMIVLGCGLVIAVWFVQEAGFLSHTPRKNLYHRKRMEEVEKEKPIRERLQK